MTNSPLLNSPLGLIKSIRQFSQLRRKCEGEIATAKRFSSTLAACAPAKWSRRRNVVGVAVPALVMASPKSAVIERTRATSRNAFTFQKCTNKQQRQKI